MTPSPNPTILRAALSGEGRLLSADPPLLDLQREAGGDLGTALAVPQLAAVVRSMQRLGAPISRPVVAAAERYSKRRFVYATCGYAPAPKRAGSRWP